MHRRSQSNPFLSSLFISKCGHLWETILKWCKQQSSPFINKGDYSKEEKWLAPESRTRAWWLTQGGRKAVYHTDRTPEHSSTRREGPGSLHYRPATAGGAQGRGHAAGQGIHALSFKNWPHVSNQLWPLTRFLPTSFWSGMEGEQRAPTRRKAPGERSFPHLDHHPPHPMPSNSGSRYIYSTLRMFFHTDGPQCTLPAIYALLLQLPMILWLALANKRWLYFAIIQSLLNASRMSPKEGKFKMCVQNLAVTVNLPSKHSHFLIILQTFPSWNRYC